MKCSNCGRDNQLVLVQVRRYREDGGTYHPEDWCIECTQGKNPIRKQYDIPDGWRS